MSRIVRMDSRSVITPPRPGGALWTAQRRAAQPVRSVLKGLATMAFTMTDLRVHDHRDPRSRCADPGVHDRPIRAFTMRRNPHPGAFRADAGRQARAALCDETGRAVALTCGTSSVTK